MHEFNETPDDTAENEIHIYTWLNATLRELTNTMKTLLKQANQKNARITFFHVYQDTSGRFKKKMISTIHSVKRNKDDDITLLSFRFEIGDVIDVNVCTNPTKEDLAYMGKGRRSGFNHRGNQRRRKFRGFRDRNGGRKRWENRDSRFGGRERSRSQDKERRRGR